MRRAIVWIISLLVLSACGRSDVRLGRINQVPTAERGEASVDEDAEGLDAVMSAQDHDARGIVFAIESAPRFGTVTLLSAGTGAFRYVPLRDVSGVDSFQFSASDGDDTDTNTMTVTIVPINDAPTIAPIAAVEGTMGQPIVGIPFFVDEGGGSDEDSQALEIVALSTNIGLIPNTQIQVDHAPDGDSDAVGGTLDLQPNANARGAAVIIVEVWEQGTDGLSASTSFVVSVACGTLASDANCNGIDDDCDGYVDDDYLPQPCGTGLCGAVSACNNGIEVQCIPYSVAASTDATCDGIDDDCDGQIDDDYVATTCGAGACVATSSCIDGSEAGCVPKALAVGETCNGIDDDCDELVDEGTIAGTPCDGADADSCELGVYACDNLGEVICVETQSGPPSCGVGCDTDGDGLADVDEEAAGTDPCVPGAYRFDVTGPDVIESDECTAFTINLLADDAALPAPAVRDITVELSSGSAKATFRSSCSSDPIAALSFPTGETTTTVYLTASANQSNVNVTVSDADDVVQADELDVHVVHMAFAGNGYVLGPLDGYAGGGYDRFTGGAIDSQGRIVAVGWSRGAAFDESRALVLRLTPNGEPDPTFGNDGIVLGPADGFDSSYAVGSGNPVDDRFFGVAIDAADRIIAVGFARYGTTPLGYPLESSLLVRLDANGSLDPSFGTAGVVLSPRVGLGSYPGVSWAGFAEHYAYVLNASDDANIVNDEFNAVRLQPDGKIVVVGRSKGGPFALEHALVARYTASGVLDTTFNSDAPAHATRGSAVGYSLDGDLAWQPLSIGQTPYTLNTLVFLDLALQSDGKIVAVGQGVVGDSDDDGPYDLEDGLIARFDADGNLDTTFASGGYWYLTPGDTFDAWRSVSILLDGRIVASGYDDATAVVAVFGTDGQPDGSFSASPAIGVRALTELPNEATTGDIVYATAVAPDGSVVAAITQTPPNGFFYHGNIVGSGSIAQINGNGDLAATYGNAGLSLTLDVPGRERFWDVVIDAQGRAVAFGEAQPRAAIVRYAIAGAVDTCPRTGGATVHASIGGIGRDMNGTVIHVADASAIEAETIANVPWVPQVTAAAPWVEIDFGGYVELHELKRNMLDANGNSQGNRGSAWEAWEYTTAAYADASEAAWSRITASAATGWEDYPQDGDGRWTEVVFGSTPPLSLKDAVIARRLRLVWQNNGDYLPEITVRYVQFCDG